MGVLAIGQNSIETGESCQLREPVVPYGAYLKAGKYDIGADNTYFQDVILLKSTGELGPTPTCMTSAFILL